MDYLYFSVPYERLQTHQFHSLIPKILKGQTEPRGDASFEVIGESADTNDFLSRERALLGDDADQFATPNDNAATVEDAGDEDEDDLLGGTSVGEGGGGGSSDMAGFESSFPAIDTSNEVCNCVDLKTSTRRILSLLCITTNNMHSFHIANGIRRNNDWLCHTIHPRPTSI